MNSLQNPIRDGIACGWKIFGGTPVHLPTGTQEPLPESTGYDVASICSRARAGISTELLSQAGLQVVLIEENPFKSSTNFNERES